jgi:3-oxoacyl-[acyl-carrier protein] reductase
VATDMLDPSVMSPEMIRKEADIPMGRVGRPEEIASTAVFLASDHASFYCGQVLSPNGGSLMA